MITPGIFYKQMKNWVGKPGGHPKGIEYLYFDKKKAFATDANAIVIVKDWPTAKAHFEDAKGTLVEPPCTPIPFETFENVSLKEAEICWSYKRNFVSQTQSKKFFEIWKNALDFVKKLTKNRKYNPLILECKNGKLTFYSIGDSVKSKVVLLEDPALDTNHWEGAFNSNYLSNAFSFLAETEPVLLSFRMAFRKDHPVLEMETEDLIFAFACINKAAEELHDLWAFARYGNDDREEEAFLS